jgi:Transcriptional regulator, effector-binding domain/component
MKIVTLPKIKCISTVHKGSYKTIEEAFDRLKHYLKKNHLKLRFPVREIYINSSEEKKIILQRSRYPWSKNSLPEFYFCQKRAFLYFIFLA